MRKSWPSAREEIGVESAEGRMRPEVVERRRRRLVGCEGRRERISEWRVEMGVVEGRGRV